MSLSFAFTVICGNETDEDCPNEINTVVPVGALGPRLTYTEFRTQVRNGTFIMDPLSIATSGNEETLELVQIHEYAPSSAMSYNRLMYMGFATVSNGSVIFTGDPDDPLSPGDAETESGDKILQKFFSTLFESFKIEGGIQNSWQVWMVVAADQTISSSSLGSSGGMGHP